MYEQGIGALIAAGVLLDVFLTVLYARIGVSMVSHRVARFVWRLFRALSKAFGRHRPAVLSLGGPMIVVMVVVGWPLSLASGIALMLHPALGTTALTAADGTASTDLVTALYAGSCSLAIGSNAFEPHTRGLRLLYIATTLVGTSLISLTLTYIMQVYTALQKRNALALTVELLTADTGDAGELLARLGLDVPWSGGGVALSELASDFTAVEEAHHVYPILFYFRFRDPCYSSSRFSLVVLDTVALLRTALDGRLYRWAIDSGAVEQLSRSAMLLVTNLVATFVPDAAGQSTVVEGAAEVQSWRRRYFRAVERLRRAGLETRADEDAGAEEYIALRACWAKGIASLAPFLAFEPHEVDPAGFAS
jgi:hypothetical protein